MEFKHIAYNEVSKYENGYNLSKEKIEGVDVVSFIIERVLCATF